MTSLARHTPTRGTLATLREDSPRPFTVGLFNRRATLAPNAVPDQFRWASVKMEVTTWLITITLSMIGLGIWNGGTKISELTAAVTAVKQNDSKQDLINEKQDTQIRALETSLAKQQGYLEQILEAVRSGERRMTR